jgi:putative ABC transport system ATP-binding protein
MTQQARREPVIEACRMMKTYETDTVPVRALRGVDLTVQAGEIVALTGAPGAGKTALLRCLAGLEPIDGGMIRLAGRRIDQMRERDMVSFRTSEVGVIHQAYNLLPLLFAVELVEFPLLTAGIRTKPARQRALAALDQVGLLEQAYWRPTELTAGQQQRVALARAIANQPAIILADDPTADLGSAAADDIMELIVQLNRARGYTFVLATHAPEVIARAGRVVRLRDGQIVSDRLVVPAPLTAPHPMFAPDPKTALPLAV